MAPVMMDTYVSNDQRSDGYPLHYAHDAFFLATCQKSGNLHSIISMTLTFVCHQTLCDGKWPFSKTLQHTSTTLTTQRPYMAIQENFVT